jgi:hypothetical protein
MNGTTRLLLAAVLAAALAPAVAGQAGPTFAVPQWASRELNGLTNDYRMPESGKASFVLPQSGCRIFMPIGRGLMVDAAARRVAAVGRTGAILYYDGDKLICEDDVSAKKPKTGFDSTFAVYADKTIREERMGRELSRIDTSLVYFLKSSSIGQRVLLFRVQDSNADGILLWLYF